VAAWPSPPKEAEREARLTEPGCDSLLLYQKLPSLVLIGKLQLSIDLPETLQLRPVQQPSDRFVKYLKRVCQLRIVGQQIVHGAHANTGHAGGPVVFAPPIRCTRIRRQRTVDGTVTRIAQMLWANTGGGGALDQRAVSNQEQYQVSLRRVRPKFLLAGRLLRVCPPSHLT